MRLKRIITLCTAALIGIALPAEGGAHQQKNHLLHGRASHYARMLEGTLTANGERYHNKRLTAAHRTLPLGTVIEVTARATGRKVIVRVNDRGPYSRSHTCRCTPNKKYFLDLSVAANRALGLVDAVADRYVTVRVLHWPTPKRLTTRR